MKLCLLPLLLVFCFSLVRGKTKDNFHSINNHHQDTIKKKSETLNGKKSVKRTLLFEVILPDSSIIRVGDTYYATGTSSEWAPHFPIFKSGDLQTGNK